MIDNDARLSARGPEIDVAAPGCGLTQAGWDGTYDPDKTDEVVYEVRGDESGPQTNNFTITGDEYEISQEEIASTRSSGVKLTARVPSAEEQ